MIIDKVVYNGFYNPIPKAILSVIAGMAFSFSSKQIFVIIKSYIYICVYGYALLAYYNAT